MKNVEIDGMDKTIQIEVALLDKEALSMLLVEFKKLFAWKLSDMLRISKGMITHDLNIDPSIMPIA